MLIIKILLSTFGSATSGEWPPSCTWRQLKIKLLRVQRDKTHSISALRDRRKILTLRIYEQHRFLTQFR